MKQIKQIGLRALIVILLLAVALCAVQREAIASNPGLSIRVHVEDPKHGLADSDMLVDVYRVANLVSGRYQAIAPYGSGFLSWDSNQEQRDLTNTLINTAFRRGTPIISGASCGRILDRADNGSALTPGLYLVVVRGVGLEEYKGTVRLDGKNYTVTLAENDEYNFQYLPSLIALLEDTGTLEISPKPDVIPKNPYPFPTPTPTGTPRPSYPPGPTPTPGPSDSPQPSESPEPSISPEPTPTPGPSDSPPPYVPPTPTRRPDPPPPDQLDPEEEEFEDIFDEDVPLGPLPQTGQLWWPVPVLGAVGLILIGAGLYLTRKDRRKRESA